MKTIYIMLTEEKLKLDKEKIFSRVYAFVAKMCMSLFITALAAWYLITAAYEERGYETVGGEYLVIPVVFFIVYKFIGAIMRISLVKVVKVWKKEK